MISPAVGRRMALSGGIHGATRVTSVVPRLLSTKVKKKEKKSSKGDTGRSRDLEIMLACLDAPKNKPPPPADEEETKRREDIRKAYTIGKFKQHNEENHDLACKMRMKRHAINMLPKNTPLKEKAMRIDDDQFPPRWRHIPAWTPPIPGFNPSEFMVLED